jgi:hypothetical protein
MKTSIPDRFLNFFATPVRLIFLTLAMFALGFVGLWSTGVFPYHPLHLVVCILLISGMTIRELVKQRGSKPPEDPQNLDLR